MDCIKKAFGSRLKSLRKSKNYTQEQLAEKIGVNIRQLARIEAGESFVTAETLYKICIILEAPPGLLFDFEFDFNGNMDLNVINDLSGENYNLLKEKLATIYDNDAKIEFINTAFDALTNKKALGELKLLIKGIELTL